VNGSQKKLTVEVDVDREINLASVQAKGLQNGEQGFASAGTSGPVANAEIVAQLMGMGFAKVGSEKAALAVSNSNLEAAMNWLVQHMEDPNLNTPPAPVASPQDTSDPQVVEQLVQLGFSADRCRFALRQTSNNMERAVDWLFSHADDPLPQENKDTGVTDTRPPKYRLVAAITHLGASTGTGHYVAHVLKEGKWIFFNDSKVSLASKLSIGQAYMYFYRKI